MRENGNSIFHYTQHRKDNHNKEYLCTRVIVQYSISYQVRVQSYDHMT